jgi:hypothetical protein
VSQSANNRYLDHLAQVEQEKSVDEIIASVSKSIRHDGKSFRGLNVWSEKDRHLLAAIADGKHTINGFRNKDIRHVIFGQSPKNKNEEKKQSAKVSRLLKILRVHGIIKKVPRTHRYQLTDKGKLLVTLLGSLKNIETKKIVALAV